MFESDSGVTAAPGSKAKDPVTTMTASPGSTKQQTTTTQQTNTPSFPGIEGVLGSDPMYQQLISFDKAASAEDLATLNRNMSQMKAYYGSDSDPLSLFGRIYQSYKDRNLQIANTLTGHGMINSGETKYQGDRATLAYQQQEYDAKFKLQQYVQGLHDSLRAAERARQLSEMQAGWQSVQDWITNNPPTTSSVDTTVNVPLDLGTDPLPVPATKAGQGSFYPVV
jgi:hypothetical protein